MKCIYANHKSATDQRAQRVYALDEVHLWKIIGKVSGFRVQVTFLKMIGKVSGFRVQVTFLKIMGNGRCLGCFTFGDHGKSASEP